MSRRYWIITLSLIIILQLFMCTFYFFRFGFDFNLGMEEVKEEQPSVNELNDRTPFDSQEVSVPHDQLEKIRRQVAKDIKNTGMFIEYHLRDMANMIKSKEKADEFRALLDEVGNHLRVTGLDLKELDHLTGLTAWREEEAAALGRLVQRRIHALQNPANCTAPKKLLCPVDTIGAGFGSKLHVLLVCFMVGYQSGRTVILYHKSKNPIGKSWDEMFHSLHSPCIKIIPDAFVHWPGSSEDETVYYPIALRMPPASLKPLAIPQDLATSIQRLTDMPGAWWVGQFATYMMRLHPEMMAKLKDIKKNLNHTSPIVGIHVRRSDKNSEARFHPLEKYMKYVEDYYNSLDMASPFAPPTPRRVYLATEEPAVLNEAKKFPTYEFLWTPNESKNAHNRYTPAALKTIVMDIFLLAHADFLVCTFSSNVCRLAFELMMALRPDASARVVSLDTVYFYDFMKPQNNIVRFPHHPDPRLKRITERTQQDSIKYLKTHHNGFLEAKSEKHVLSVVWGTAWNGYTPVIVSEGNNHDTKLIPDYKLQQIPEVVKVPFRIKLPEED